jgi:hypothetical protein
MANINPISSAFRDVSDHWTAQGETFCKTAHTVTAGALCDEPTIISDACRSPTNKLDAFVCDDPKMAAVQDTVWGALKSFASSALGALLGRLP